MADEVAVARVAAGAAFVGELLQLADVVKHDAGEHQIFVRAVGARDQAADLGHLRDVLEKAAAIGVMNLLRRRPDAQLRFVVGDDAIQQDADVIVLDAAEMLLQLRPHLVDRPRRAEDRILLAKALLAILIGIDAADRRQHQLHLAVVEAAAALDAHELAGVEFVLVAIDVGHQLRDDLRRSILQREEQELAAAAAGAKLLVGAEKESPAGVFDGQCGEFGELLFTRAKRKRHRAVDDDAAVDRGAAAEHAHAAAQPLDGGFDDRRRRRDARSRESGRAPCRGRRSADPCSRAWRG